MAEPKVYNENNMIQMDLGTSIINRYFDLLTWNDNETIMDIGMGDGKFTTEVLLNNIPKDLSTLLIGVDLPKMVQFAKQQYSLPNVQFEELDIQSRNLREDFIERFDHVFSFWVFHWLRDLRQAFENMFLMMKPGSEFLICVPEMGLDHVYYNLWKNPKWASYGCEKYISKFMHIKDRLPNWRRLLQDVGFVDLNCFRERNIYKHGDKESAINGFASLDHIASKIPKEQQEEYRRDFIAELRKAGTCSLETCPKTKEEICVTKVASLIIYGKKPKTRNHNLFVR